MDVKSIEILPDFIKRIRNEKGLSTTEIQERSRRGGRKGVSDGYVSLIENDHIKNVSHDKLKAIADGLGITHEEIFAVARGDSPNSSAIADERFARISKGFANLPENERRSLEPLLTAVELTIEKNEQNQKPAKQIKPQVIKGKQPSKESLNFEPSGAVKKKPNGAVLPFTNGAPKSKKERQTALERELDKVFDVPEDEK